MNRRNFLLSISALALAPTLPPIPAGAVETITIPWPPHQAGDIGVFFARNNAEMMVALRYWDVNPSPGLKNLYLNFVEPVDFSGLSGMNFSRSGGVRIVGNKPGAQSANGNPAHFWTGMPA